MKKYLIILSLFILAGFTGFAQDDEQPPEDQGGKLQQRMSEYIQKRLNMTRAEADKFRPIFLRYMLELRRTHREFKGDRPVLQLKVAELRVKARNEFREVLDEKRANRVFDVQRDFEIKVMDEIRNRRLERRGGVKRANALQF
jgi:Spy/CpxP family protein refolding chaperone